MTQKQRKQVKPGVGRTRPPQQGESELASQFIDAAVLNPKQAKAMLDVHPELRDARVLHGETILHFLAVEGFTEAVRFVGELGFDVNATNRFGDPPLIDVCNLGKEKMAEVLIQLGADVNVVSPTSENPLHCAVQSGKAALVELLLRSGADPGYVTTFGFTIVDALPSSAKRLALEKVLQRFGIRTETG
jgi:ankyrin repeat protein